MDFREIEGKRYGDDLEVVPSFTVDIYLYLKFTKTNQGRNLKRRGGVMAANATFQI